MTPPDRTSVSASVSSEGPLGPAAAGEGVRTASAAAGTSGGAGFSSSLGISLVVHGAVVATLALSMRPWAAPRDAYRGQEFSAHLAVAEPPPAAEPEEVLEEILPDEPKEELPLYEELELPESPYENVFPEAPAPSKGSGTTLLESVVYPRITPIEREVEVEPPVEMEVEEPQPESVESPAMIESSPEPVEGACPPPVYPRVAEIRGWSGTVVLLIDVAVDGSVVGVRIESSSGYGVLDDAAVDAVRGWRFAPAMRGGEPAEAVVRKPIRFGER